MNTHTGEILSMANVIATTVPGKAPPAPAPTPTSTTVPGATTTTTTAPPRRPR